jgi:UDPglucose 6-dehydrogenase
MVAPASSLMIEFGTSAYDVADDADALVLITEWNEFRSLDLARLKSAMRSAVLVDLRNVYRHDEVIRHGFAYTSIGREAGRVPHGATESAE